MNSALYPSVSLINPCFASLIMSSDDLLEINLESLSFSPNQATAVLNLKSLDVVPNKVALLSITLIISMLLSPSGFL
ncbi:hypothetical protein D3C85_1850910 [compost metagenome]